MLGCLEIVIVMLNWLGCAIDRRVSWFKSMLVVLSVSDQLYLTSFRHLNNCCLIWCQACVIRGAKSYCVRFLWSARKRDA